MRNCRYFKDTLTTSSLDTTYDIVHSGCPTASNDTTLLGVIEKELPTVINSFQGEVKYYEWVFTSSCQFFYLHYVIYHNVGLAISNEP